MDEDLFIGLDITKLPLFKKLNPNGVKEKVKNLLYVWCDRCELGYCFKKLEEEELDGKTLKDAIMLLEEFYKAKYNEDIKEKGGGDLLMKYSLVDLYEKLVTEFRHQSTRNE